MAYKPEDRNVTGKLPLECILDIKLRHVLLTLICIVGVFVVFTMR